jgi:hypothetical protein
MRSAALVSLVVAPLAGCDIAGVVDGTDEPPDDEDTSVETCAGVSPAPYCGEGACSCCGSCDPRRELCFAAGWQLELGYGRCYSLPVAGSLTAMVGGVAFTANEVAAVASEGYMQIDGRIESRLPVTDPQAPIDYEATQLTLQLPAQLGTFDCTDTSFALFAYTQFDTIDGDQVEAWNQLSQMPRPPCSFSITAIGAVGERIEGTFAVTLVDRNTSTAVDIVDGTFSVERVLFP